ncbi:MAG: hypothetical protein HZA91_18235 [Verrucomicrobia bacterium]|nr:hypothetical protein [Verrucomicrobiota bacterium]
MTWWRLFWVTVLAVLAVYYFGRHPIQNELSSVGNIKAPKLMDTGPFQASKPRAPSK